ncbi:MAG: DNA polymerase/3'-5' exonuclease PolX [Candidatus Methylomirabilales bacterium]
MKNADVARCLNEIADILEIRDENPFRVRAYRRGAQVIEGLTEDLAAIQARGELLAIPGIGKDLAGKIQECLACGQIAYLEELRQLVPAGVVELMRIPGLGPKTAKLLHERMGVDSVDALEALAREGKLAGLPGIKAKTEENILKGIRVWRSGRERMPIGNALPVAEMLAAHLGTVPGVRQIAVAGSLRRMRETVKDIDVLVVSDAPAAVMAAFVGYAGVAEVLAQGETKSSVRLRDIQVDLRVVEPEAFGAALQYFTGSKQHNIRVRELAQRRGLKLSEYGVFDEAERRVAGATEAEVYQAVGLPWIPPELREDAGEIEAAQQGRLPALVRLEDMRGDLQMHSTWSDGRPSVAELAEAGRAKGYSYIALTDHSKSATIARGMPEERVLQMLEDVAAVNARMTGFRVFAGCEVDIRADGGLDYADDLLARLDLVQISVHSRFKMSREEMTARIVKAVQHPLVHVLGHPTGRLLGERAAYEVDLEAILGAARAAGIAIEINASPQRLDLSDLAARRAKELGIPIVISTDAHAVGQLDWMRFGVAVARRAWLAPSDVLNTRSEADLGAWLAAKRARRS